MRKNESVTVSSGQGVVSCRHELRLKELSPTSCSKDFYSWPVLLRQMWENVLFGPRVHSVVPYLIKVHRCLYLTSSNYAEKGAIVAGYTNKTYFSAVLKPIHAVD